MIDIKLKRLHPAAVLPSAMTTHAAGYDLAAALDTAITIEPGTTALVPTGWAIQLPVGIEAQIRPRSGLALKHGVSVLNSPGTIDPDYRGEVKVILHNFGKTAFEVTPGMRIAQMVLARYEQADFTIKAELEESKRGQGGFGHTSV